MKLIVQIPAFNEEKTIAQTLRDIPKKIDGFNTVETLVIDDGSSDGTVDAARKAGASHVVLLKNHRGLAAAFVAGIDAALRLGADAIVNTDADNQYAGSDIAKLVAPIVRGSADVVVGDRQVAKSPHMSAVKRALQRLGSWTVGKASGLSVADVTSGFRAFSREAAQQINVFNPFTYTLETIIQAGNHNLGVSTVTVRTNAPTRPSRLYHGVGTYLRKSIATIFRVYALYRPLKTFFAIGSVLMLGGTLLGVRFIWDYSHGYGSGHVQSLILCGVLLITGFQTWLIALLADLVGVNRRLSEEVLVRLKKLESPGQQPARAREPRSERDDRLPRREQPRVERQQQAARPEQPARREPATAAAKQMTQWVWLLDEEKLGGQLGSELEPEEESPEELAADEPKTESTGTPGGRSRRRRRRRGGPRQTADLPGNRGKHLGDE